LTSPKLGDRAIKPGDEVIGVAAGFPTTVNPILQFGAVPVFVDVDRLTHNIDASKIEAAISPKTKAIMLAHSLGNPFNLDVVTALCKKYKLWLVEDCCDALGTTYRGQMVGTFGDIATLSFYPAHHITTGEGGIITTNDDALADRLRIYRNQGMRQRYQYEMAGTNYRMTDVQAAIGIPQLRKINAINAARQKNAETLNELFADVTEIATPVTSAGNSHVWHQYTIRVLEGAKRSRDEVIEFLTAQGVGCGIYYPYLAHDYDCFRGNSNIEPTPTPVAARLVREVISLPVHQYLTEENLSTIATAVRTAVRG
jgi:dTDP-4-amino-4,6-dideoxygalactose transaminase